MTLDGRAFEDEVRRVARALWPVAEYDGAVILGGTERDGRFETDDAIHLLECTTWRTKEKAQKDIAKLRDGIGRLNRSDKPVLGWFITLSEPTADQRALIKKGEPIRALGFDQFRSKLIDSRRYLELRDQYAFGSARDPETGAINAPENYVPIRLAVERQGTLEVSALADALQEAGRYLLLADYGSGKSMTLREVYRRLAKDARKERSIRFPVHVNLRDHQGQTSPVEVLERHARNLGFPNPHQVVRAWRGSQTHLILDGFDEIATLGWQGPTKNLKAIRRSSVKVVRAFVDESPPGTGLLIAGREHFFDSRSELLSALGTSYNFEAIVLSDFSSDQIDDFLKRLGWSSEVPAWVPGRPLLLGYLAARGLLAQVLEVTEGTPPAVAWDYLLEKICAREAQIEVGIDEASVRRIIERLASLARTTLDGIGPVFFPDVERSFREIVGYPPDDPAMVLLQRLPGLGAPDPQDQSRRFVDEQLVDAARAGDIVQLIDDPFRSDAVDDTNWSETLGSLGVQLVAHRAATVQGRANVRVLLDRLSRSSDHSVLLADLVRVACEIGVVLTAERPIVIQGVALRDFIWSGGSRLDTVTFSDSTIEHLEMPVDSEDDHLMPRFRRCSIGMAEGRLSERDLPVDRFVDCDIGSVSSGNATSAGILASGLPSGTRVALTILKKLYRQRGSARKESALRRGMKQADRSLVSPVLEILEAEGLTVGVRLGGESIWSPTRKATDRASRMLDAPATSVDPVLTKTAGLS